MAKGGPRQRKGLFSIFNNEIDEEQVEEEIISMVNEGHEQGLIETDEMEMISNVFEFGDKEAKDIEDDIEYKNAIKHVVISSLALKKYDKVCSILSNKNLQTVSEVAALIIAKFNINRESFDQWYLKEIISDNEGDEHLLVLNLLVEYLKKPDKKKLYLIEDTKLLMKSLTNILANT